MADDIFSQLLELFNQPGPVNWKLAREIASQLTGERQPVDPWLADEYIELGRLAQLQIQAATPLGAPDSLDVVPTDRREWATQQLQAFAYLVEPLAQNYESMGGSDPMSQMLRPLGPALLGMQMGSTVGFLAHRSLGQFEIGLPVNPPSARYIIVDNVESFAVDHSLDARQVRLWVSLRNGVHDAAFARPWLRERVIDLIERHLTSIELNTSTLMETLQNLSDPTQIQEIMGDPSALTSFISPSGPSDDQDQALAIIGLVSGYGEYVLNTAAAKLIPDLADIRRSFVSKQDEPGVADQLITRMVGLELTHELHAIGTAFCTDVDRRWGSEALNQVWDDPEHLPSYDELGDPVAWAARVLLPEF